MNIIYKKYGSFNRLDYKIKRKRDGQEIQNYILNEKSKAVSRYAEECF